MSFYNIYNNAINIPVIATFTDTTPSIILWVGTGDILPATNWKITVEKYNSSSEANAREVISYTTRTGDIISWLTRAVEMCVQDDTATPRTRTQNTLDFTPATGETVFVSQYYTEWNDTDIKNAINNGAIDSEVVHNTGAESIDGVKTFTESPIVPTPTTDFQASTKKYVDDQLWSISSFVDVFTLWESIAVWDSVRYGLDIWNESSVLWSSQLTTFTSTTNYEIGQWVTYSNSILRSITIKATRNDTYNNTTNFNIEIYSDASFTNLLWTSTNSIIWNDLVELWLWATRPEYTLYFDFIPVTTNFYWKINSLWWGTIWSSYSVWLRYDNTDSYPWGTAYRITNGNVVTAQTWDIRFKVNDWLNEENVWKVYRASSVSTETAKVIWLSKEDWILDEVKKVTLWGIQWWYTWLTRWETYKLQDNWTIWLTAGTVDVNIWRAISDTEINFITPL